MSVLYIFSVLENEILMFKRISAIITSITVTREDVMSCMPYTTGIKRNYIGCHL